MQELTIYSALNLSNGVKTKKLFKGKKIVLISPHSDDISVSFGGTASLLAKTNKVIPVLFFTGFRGVKEKRDRAILIREKEMAKEAKILGLEKPVFLRLDSYNEDNLLVREEDILKVERFLGQKNPDIIFLPKKDDLHPRHKLATIIASKALEAPFLKKKILFFYENPWSLFNPLEFNTIFILSKKEIEKQKKAIKAHVSQLKRTSFEKAAISLSIFRGAVTPEQRIFGYGKGNKDVKINYIEAFKVCE